MPFLLLTSDLDDKVDTDVPDEAYHLIGRIITGWAKLEYWALRWVMDVCQIEEPAAATLVGRMDMRGKMDRAQSILTHQGKTAEAAAIKKIKTLGLRYLARRNDLAHGVLIGRLKDTETLLFVMTKYQQIPRENDDDEIEIAPIIHRYPMGSLRLLDCGISGMEKCISLCELEALLGTPVVPREKSP